MRKIQQIIRICTAAIGKEREKKALCGASLKNEQKMTVPQSPKNVKRYEKK